MNSGETEQAGLSAYGDPAFAAELVHAIASGDRDAEQRFVGRYLPQVRAMLIARLRDRDRAADLVQDTMIEVLCALRGGQVREPEKLTAFVLAVARNVLNSHFRKSSHRTESLEFPDNLPDLHSSADSQEVEHRLAVVSIAVSSLDPTDRSILEMTLHDGLKPGEIARRLNLSSDLVRQRKVRATRRIVDMVRDRSQTPFKNHTLPGRTQ